MFLIYKIIIIQSDKKKKKKHYAYLHYPYQHYVLYPKNESMYFFFMFSKWVKKLTTGECSFSGQ